MKLPAVAIAAAFVVGIVIGLHPAIAAHANSRELLVGLFIFAVLREKMHLMKLEKY